MIFGKETIETMSRKLKERKFSVVDVVEQSFENMEKTQDLNVVRELMIESAFRKAEEIDESIKQGKDLPLLAGMPVVIKDNISMKDTFTTCSSKFLRNYKSPYNATVVDKLEQAGAIIVAKVNMDEFAMGSSSENCAFGPIKNPKNPEYVPGGSSGGSAAAVAGNMCMASLGTDTGGSIRQPSAYCGVVGLKPTYGLVSRYGVVAFASSLDQVGPITKNVRESAIMLDAIAGHDPREFTSSETKKFSYFENSFKDDVRGMKIGYAKQFFEDLKNEAVLRSVRRAFEFFERNGAEIVEVELPHLKDSLAVYYILSSAEAASNLARFDGIRYGIPTKESEDLIDFYVKSRTQGFGKEVKRRIMLGNFVLSSGFYDAYYKKAKDVQNLIIHEFKEAFKKCDTIISPTTPTSAFKIGEKIDNPLEMYLNDIYTVPVNIATLPAISVPCENDVNGMPLGIQFIGDRFSESKLFNLADYYERYAYKGELYEL